MSLFIHFSSKKNKQPLSWKTATSINDEDIMNVIDLLKNMQILFSGLHIHLKFLKLFSRHCNKSCHRWQYFYSLRMLIQSFCVGPGWCCIVNPPLPRRLLHTVIFFFPIPRWHAVWLGVVSAFCCILQAVRPRCGEQPQLSRCRRGFFSWRAAIDAAKLNKEQINSRVASSPPTGVKIIFYRLRELCL